MVLVEGARSVFLGTQAFLVDDDRELAWAEKHVRKHPTLRYLIGRYVEADNANSNGHIFDLKELEAAQHDIAHTPLNLLHRPNYIVGHYVAAELMFPTEAAGEGMVNPYVEALGVFYRYYFPAEFAVIEKAHKEGSLYFSMECVPKSITCAAICGQEYAYDGRSSPTYCAHLNQPGAKRRLNGPNFTGGALIVPPVKPGWQRADVTQLSALMAEHADEADRIYEEVKTEMPEMSSQQWEGTVHQLIVMAYDELEGEHARDFSTEQRKALAKKGHALPDGSYPIVNAGDLANAIQAIGRAGPGKRSQVIAHIKKRAAALGLSSKTANLGKSNSFGGKQAAPFGSK
jgi:hypothetical protein